MNDVELRIKNKNQILFTRESSCLQQLKYEISNQTHLTLVLWVFDCLQIPLNELNFKYPNTNIKQAYETVLKWAHGSIKMTEAKKEILRCHGITKSLTNPYDIALFHAIGQGLATVHVETHALGLVFYELTAIVIKNNYFNYEEEVNQKIQFYLNKLTWYENNAPKYENKPWAKFLIVGKINKEKLLNHKKNLN